MATWVILKSFNGPITSVIPGGPTENFVAAGTKIDDTIINQPALLAAGCPMILFNPATMTVPLADFLSKTPTSGGTPKPEENLLDFFAGAGVFGGVTTGVGPSTTLYVDPAGHDVGPLAGQRGNAALPFLTTQAAINAANNGDVVQHCGASFPVAAPLVFPLVTPNGGGPLTRLTIVGESIGIPGQVGGTALVAAAGLDCLTPNAAGANVQYLALVNLALVASGAGRALVLDATAGAGTGYALGLFLAQNCSFSDAGKSALKNVTNAQFVDSLIFSPTFDINTCSGVNFENCILGNVNLLWDDTQASKPLAGRQSISFVATTLQGALQLSGQPALTLDSASNVRGGIAGNAIVVAGGLNLQMVCRGTVSAGIDFGSAPAFQLPDSATKATVDLAQSRLPRGAINIGVAGAAANRQQVDMKGTVVGGGAPLVLTAGPGVDIDGRGWALSSTVTLAAGGTGAIQRRHTETLLFVGGGTLGWSTAFGGVPLTSPNYSVGSTPYVKAPNTPGTIVPSIQTHTASSLIIKGDQAGVEQPALDIIVEPQDGPI